MLCVHVHIQGSTSPYGQECLLFFDASVGLNSDGLPVATQSHITYALKSCCFSHSNLLFSLSLSFSACLPSVPFIFHHPSLFLQPTERSVCGAQRQKKARQAQDLSERIQHPPGPVEQQHEHTLPLENRESTRVQTHTHRIAYILFLTQSLQLLL